MTGLLKNVFRSIPAATSPGDSGEIPAAKDDAVDARKPPLDAAGDAPTDTTTPVETTVDIKSKTKTKRQSKAVVVLRGEDGERTEGLLANLDQQQVLDEDDYKQRMRDDQTQLLCLQRAMGEEKKRGLMVVLEGPDAAGKGGVIKRFTEKLDPRTIRVYSIIKPSTEEYARHYMWRFWTKIPPYGHFAIFDRSWYGRVLVERVEGFARSEEWKRAYGEINEFERQLTDDGMVIVKIFLQITKEEQLTRFKRRSSDPLKHWKISEEDWRNRRKWDEHIEAAEDMFARTSTKSAPWHVIPADSKWFARIQTLRLIIRSLEKAGIKA